MNKIFIATFLFINLIISSMIFPSCAQQPQDGNTGKSFVAAEDINSTETADAPIDNPIRNEQICFTTDYPFEIAVLEPASTIAYIIVLVGLPNPCYRHYELTQKYDNNTFEIGLTICKNLHDSCITSVAGFLAFIELDIGELEAGTYTVYVNGGENTFEIRPEYRHKLLNAKGATNSNETPDTSTDRTTEEKLCTPLLMRYEYYKVQFYPDNKKEARDLIKELGGKLIVHPSGGYYIKIPNGSYDSIASLVETNQLASLKINFPWGYIYEGIKYSENEIINNTAFLCLELIEDLDETQLNILKRLVVAYYYSSDEYKFYCIVPRQNVDLMFDLNFTRWIGKLRPINPGEDSF